jgi:hypothetical protein
MDRLWKLEISWILSALPEAKTTNWSQGPLATRKLTTANIFTLECSIGITRSPLKSHRFSDPRNSVSMKTHFKLFIKHGNHDDSFVEVIIHICMVFGLISVVWFIRNVEFNKYRKHCCNSQKPLVDPIQRTNMRGLMAERLRAFDLCTEGHRFESRWIFFSFYFFPFIFNFYV